MSGQAWGGASAQGSLGQLSHQATARGAAFSRAWPATTRTASRLLLGLCSTPAQCEPHSALSKWAGPGPRERGRGQNGPQCALLPSARLLLRHAPMKRVWGTERCSGTDRGLAGLEGGGAGGVLTFTDSRGPRPRSRPSYLTSLSRFLLGRAAVETVRPGAGWEPSEHPACSCP